MKTMFLKKSMLKNCDFLSKIDLFSFPPPELTCMSSYHLLLKFPPIKYTVFLHPQKFKLLAWEVWEVALYVFLKEMPYSLNVVKPISMNVEKF